MKKVATGTLKGGTGKTMVLISIAGVIAEKKKVLIVDADPQCNATTNLGIDNRDLSRPCIIDALNNPDTAPEEVIIKSPLKGLPNLDVLPSNILLTEVEMNLYMRSNRERLFDNWINKNISYFLNYDYIFFDTNPSMGLINQNIFTASDSIILVSDVGFNGVLGAEMFMYLWDKRRADLGLENNVRALVLNNVDSRINLSSQIKEYMANPENELDTYFIEPALPARVAYKNAEGNMIPISLYAPESEESNIVKKLVKNLKKEGVL
jgi:chromosome partitioning protein